MNYPIWNLEFAGGGLLIAVMAVLHVYVAHFAVGGGLFLVLAEMRARRANSSSSLAWVKGHTRFFLLLTMVFGGVTGVGIWFTIALLNPAATSTLIHTFVFGWATEWVCFFAEIAALFIYYYTFNRMRAREHLRIGWLYFLFAWLSLFLINGIIAFMLTPGGWLEGGNFWAGFFNPSMWPSLAFRTGVALVLAGLFGFMGAVWVRDRAEREGWIRWCAGWLLAPFAFMLLAGWWYYAALPEDRRELILGRSPEILPFLRALLWIVPVLAVGGLVMALRAPALVKRPLAVALFLVGLLYMGAFEWIREAGRKPYVIHGYMYANGIRPEQVGEINRRGYLARARWTRHKEVTPENRLAAGEELFVHQCAACHSRGGPINDILPATAKYTLFSMEAQLVGLGRINRYMPGFFGTPRERQALARYIVEGLHGRKPEPPNLPRRKLSLEIPERDPGESPYVLLTWNNLGMHCISDSDPWWVLLPPANDLFAQVIRKGDPPRVVTEGIEVTFRVEPGFEKPQEQVRFWEFAEPLFGKKLPPGRGLAGFGVSGTMHAHAEHHRFSAELIPVVPYPADGTYNPYPLFTVTAREKKTGRVLARTRVVAPTSTEMGCRNCHGGPWRKAGVAGISDLTAEDILDVHDKHARTDLEALAREGRPRLCQSCHPDPVLNAQGDPRLLNLPAAIHGWHANYLTGRGADACSLCHPASATGPTGCLRGVHATRLTCVDCHGYLEDHALSLLKAERQKGKKGAARLMRHLRPRMVDRVAAINPRASWINEPDCLTCHQGFAGAEPGKCNAFNRWTRSGERLYRNRTDLTGKLMCIACHGSPHANYPARNPFHPDRDNIQPLYYMGTRGSIGQKGRCGLCHLRIRGVPRHHPNMR